MIRRELFIFLIVGTLTVLVDFLIYSGLIWIELADINIAKAGGFIAGTIFAYLANRFWTFSHKQYESGSLWRFGIVYTFTLCVNVLANSFVLTLLIDYNAAFQIAFLLATGSSATLNFLGMKFFVFSSKVTL